MQPSDRQSHPESLSPRGVGLASYRCDGYPVMIAVDSAGRCIAHVVLHRGLTPSRVRASLRNMLDAADPQVKLRLL